MHKRLILSLGILFATSSLYASNTTSSEAQQPNKIRQQEVDLNKFQNEEVLKLAVKELSKNVPQKIDSYTTLIDVTSKDLSLIYVYEIHTGAKSDEAVRSEDQVRMRKAVTKGTCESSKRFLESGISLSYLYLSSKSKEKLFQIDVSQKDCPSF